MSTTSQPGRRRSDRRGAPPRLIAAAIPSAAGVLLLVLGWMAVSGEAAFDDQQAGLNLAIFGGLVVFVGCGSYLWIFRQRISRRVKALRVAVLGETDVFEGGSA